MSEHLDAAHFARRLEAGEDSTENRKALTQRLGAEGLRWAWTDVETDNGLGTGVWIGLPEHHPAGLTERELVELLLNPDITGDARTAIRDDYYRRRGDVLGGDSREGEQ